MKNFKNYYLKSRNLYVTLLSIRRSGAPLTLAFDYLMGMKLEAKKEQVGT
jgi:hypothetical protein